MDEELKPSAPAPDADVAAAAELVGRRAAGAQAEGRMPAVYLGHGAPPLVDDPLWVAQLGAWGRALPRPHAILMVSAHWEAAPATLGATRDGVPLVYDFYGFPERYYETRYPAPAAPELAARVRDLLAPEQVAEHPQRGLDHGAYVPLLVMYPEADVPVLQLSLPNLDPLRLFALGEGCGHCATRGCSSSAADFSPTACRSCATFASTRRRRPGRASSTAGRARRSRAATSRRSRAFARRQAAATPIPRRSTSCRSSSPSVPAAAQRRR